MITFKLIGVFLLAGPAGLTLFGGFGSAAGLLERFLELIGIGPTPDGSAVPGAESSSPAELSKTGSFLELTVQQFGLHFLAIGFILAPA